MAQGRARSTTKAVERIPPTPDAIEPFNWRKRAQTGTRGSGAGAARADPGTLMQKGTATTS